jgi:magnesium-transporting ATPase (P-type)
MELPEKKKEVDPLELDREEMLQKMGKDFARQKKLILILIQSVAVVFLVIGLIKVLPYYVPAIYLTCELPPFDPFGELALCLFNAFESLFLLCYCLFYGKPIFSISIIPTLFLTLIFAFFYQLALDFGGPR